MQIVSCLILFSGKIRKNIINLSSAELAQRVVNVIVLFRKSISVDNLRIFFFLFLKKKKTKKRKKKHVVGTHF